MTREPPNRYSPPCVLRVAGGRPPAPRQEQGRAGCQGPSQPKPCLSGICEGEPDTTATNSHAPTHRLSPPSRSLRLGPRGTNFRGGGLRMGGHFHPRFLERLEGELGESSDRCLWPRAAARAVTGAHSQRWGCSEGAATHHRCPGVVLTLIAPGPERGQPRPPRSRSKSSCAERGQGALWALGHAGSFAQWAGHAGNYLKRGVYSPGRGAV